MKVAILLVWKADVIVQAEVIRAHLAYITAMGRDLSVLEPLKVWLF